MIVEFYTKYNKDNSEIFTNPGSPVLQEYEYTLDKEGHKVLTKKDSFIDVYSKIQANYESTDINYLMERFALGDTEALDINKGFFIDARELPTTLAEVYQKGLEAEQYFEGLPVELKEMFDNSHSVFYTEMGSKSFENKVTQYNDRFVNHQFDEPEVIKTDNTQEINHNE